MSKIKGRYILRASLGQIVNGYAFTSSDRNVELSSNTDFMINLLCDDIDRPINKSVSFVSNNILNVVKARLLTSGAPGLQPAKNSSVAASILLVGRDQNDIISDPLGGFSFGLDYFGKWQEINISFLPNKKSGNYYLSVDHSYSKIFFDDFNLQSDYIGESFSLFLELEIDTAGLLDNGGNIV